MGHYDAGRHHRRSIRLKGYDYSQHGAYFVAFCIQNRASLLGRIVGGELRLNDAGRMVEEEWLCLDNQCPFVETDAYVVMPNHFHGILLIIGEDVGAALVFAPDFAGGAQGHHKDGDHKARLYRPHGTLSGTLGRVVQAFKWRTTHRYIMGVRQSGWPPFAGRLWQRNYYEHIIRDAADLNRIRQYIATNPLRWALDELNPATTSDR